MIDTRYAVYFAPAPDHPLWSAGCRWLGRDATDPQDLGPPRRPELSAPWRYGFHATLKAPLRLSPPHEPEDLVARVELLAARHVAFTMPALEVGALGNFLALRPAEPLDRTHALRRLADDVVQTIDPCRAALSDAERLRHGRAAGSERQRAHLERWGYPHVLEDWRFHMTLTGTLDEADPLRAELHAEAEQHFAGALATPLRCNDIALFRQPAAGQPFHLWRRVPLARA